MTERLHFDFSLSCIGEGNGNPLQCSCLENPRDGGAWWAAIYGVAQSRTWLKWLSSSSSSVYMAPGGERGNPLQYSCLENPQEQRSLVSYSPRGRKGSDTTGQLNTAQHSLHMSVLISQFLPPFLPALCPRFLRLYSYPGNRFICNTFLDSTYMH